MAQYKLSIIIPVYNVEKYLGECLNSILKQQHDGCEIILIDDGSTDSSGFLCDGYRAEDITVIHKQNGGLSSARNAGLDVASGKYVAFLDSDDRLSDGSIPSILEWIDKNDADICFMDAIVFYPDGRSRSLGDCIDQEEIRGKSKEEVFLHLSTRPKYPGSACTKLYRRDFLSEHGLRFPDDKRLSEDLGYVLDCMLTAEKFDCLNIPYYEYRQNREGSITARVDMKTFSGMQQFVEGASEKLCSGKIPNDRISEYSMSFVAYEYSIMVWRYAWLNAQDKKCAKTVLKKYKWVMAFSRSKKCKLVRWLINIAGLSAGSKILDMYLRNK
ncbi:MAG: glycosyltransferase [Lachnospiraceae bacterium]|nr:glycosyltransferase [Lachnospiraceae bacterium]